RPLRSRKRRGRETHRDLPPRGTRPHGGSRDALADRRFRHLVRGEVRLLALRVRLGGVSTVDARVLDAARRQLGLIALLVALAAFAWWSTVRSMGGMGASPGTDLGTLGWFVGVWIVMMAAMMLPAVSPTVALYTRMTRQRGLARPVTFTSGYLVVWGAAGVGAYGLYALGHHALGTQLTWHAGGRWVAGSVLAVAALYELTPLKDVCL